MGHCLGSLETVQGTAYVQLAACQQSLGRGTVETLKKQAFGGETCMETSENPLKKLTVNRRNFTNTFKFTANTNRIYTPCHITPRPAVKNAPAKRFKQTT